MDRLFSELAASPAALAAAGLAAVAVLIALLVAVLAWRGARARSLDDAARAAGEAIHAQALAHAVQELTRLQAETSGRVRTMGDVLAHRQGELARAVAERLDSTSHRLNEGMSAAARATHENLTRIAERLVLVEAAERSLSELSGEVIALRETLGNKQARGAFGQARMEAIISDGLPRDAFAFQYTLADGRRPDCAVFLPGDPRPLLIDSKFPLESITAFREAASPEAKKAAAQRVRADLMKHVNDVAERYLVPGQTQDIALIFVPSESVYAEIHTGFDAVIQQAYRARVVLVSPSLLMLAVQVVQAIAKDARMRAQADRIRAEVGALVADVSRLRERVGELSRHFAMVGDDVAKVLISADKIARRGLRLEQLDFDADGPEGAG